MQINAPFNPIASDRARRLLGAASVSKPRVVNLLVNKSDTPKANGGIAFDGTDACPADAFGIAPPSGFEPGDKLRAGAAMYFETKRDNTCQEVGLHVELHNKTGGGNTTGGSMSDGKTGFHYAIAGYPGGGQMWGIAGTCTLKPGYTGKFAAGVEFDLNNNDTPSGFGYSAKNVCGIFQNGVSEYMSLAAHWIVGTIGATGPAFYDIGTFYQENASGRLIRTATIMDDTSSDTVLLANEGKFHPKGTIVDKSAGLVALDVQGNKADSFVWTRGMAPIGLKLQGTVEADGIQIDDKSKNAINVIGPHAVSALNTREATVPYAVITANNQKVRLGPYSMYSDGSKLYFMNENTQTLIASIDGSGNGTFLGQVRSGTP